MVKSTDHNFSDDYEELDFSVEEESWNEYELSDGSKIKARIVLKKIRRNPNHPEALSFDFVPPIYVVTSPAINRGEKGKEPQPQEYKSVPTFEVKILGSQEKLNLYRIMKTGQTLRTKLSVVKIDRVVGKFDNEGMPFYVVNSGPLITLDDPNLKSGQ